MVFIPMELFNRLLPNARRKPSSIVTPLACTTQATVASQIRQQPPTAGPTPFGAPRTHMQPQLHCCTVWCCKTGAVVIPPPTSCQAGQQTPRIPHPTLPTGPLVRTIQGRYASAAIHGPRVLRNDLLGLHGSLPGYRGCNTFPRCAMIWGCSTGHPIPQSPPAAVSPPRAASGREEAAGCATEGWRRAAAGGGRGRAPVDGGKTEG